MYHLIALLFSFVAMTQNVAWILTKNITILRNKIICKQRKLTFLGMYMSRYVHMYTR